MNDYTVKVRLENGRTDTWTYETETLPEVLKLLPETHEGQPYEVVNITRDGEIVF